MRKNKQKHKTVYLDWLPVKATWTPPIGVVSKRLLVGVGV